MKLKVVESIKSYDDNEMSIALIKNIKSKYHIKQINMQYHQIGELVNKRKLTIK